MNRPQPEPTRGRAGRPAGRGRAARGAAPARAAASALRPPRQCRGLCDPRLPAPQRRARSNGCSWQRRRRRTTPASSICATRACRCACSPTARAWRPDDPPDHREARLVQESVAHRIRPGDLRRRPGRPERRGVRRLRRAEDRAGRALGASAGRPAAARGSRTTSGFPERHQRRRAGRAGARAGVQVRRRDPARARRRARRAACRAGASASSRTAPRSSRARRSARPA